MHLKEIKELKLNMMPALKSKVDEFQLIGYEGISYEQIWDALFNNVWKKQPPKQNYQIMQDIMEFSVNTYMDLKQADALKHTKFDLAQSIKALT